MTSHLQLVLILVVIVFFVLVLLLLKNRALSLKYTLIWLFAGIVMAVMVCWPKALILVSGLLGIETPMYALFVLALGFVLCILMALTSIVSRQAKKITTLVQAVGLLEERVVELENIQKGEQEK